MSDQAPAAHLRSGAIDDACLDETGNAADDRVGTGSMPAIGEICAQMTTEPKDLEAQKAVEGRSPERGWLGRTSVEREIRQRQDGG